MTRAVVYSNHADHDRAIAVYNEAIRLSPKNNLNLYRAFLKRGDAYAFKGDHDRAIADYTEAIRLSPKNALAFCSRGTEKLNIKDASGNADLAKARELDASVCPKRVNEQAEQQRGLFTIRSGMEASWITGDMSSNLSRSIEECEQKCAQRSTCNVFSYNRTGGCYLYSRAELKPNANFDSGVRN